MLDTSAYERGIGRALLWILCGCMHAFVSVRAAAAKVTAFARMCFFQGALDQKKTHESTQSTSCQLSKPHETTITHSISTRTDPGQHIAHLFGERDLLPPRGGDFPFASPFPRGPREFPEDNPDPERRLRDLPRDPDLDPDRDREREGAMAVLLFSAPELVRRTLHGAPLGFLEGNIRGLFLKCCGAVCVPKPA
jgi:hypothetical protein